MSTQDRQNLYFNTEVAVQSRIAELSYDSTLTDNDIAGLIYGEFGVTVTETYVSQVISDFVADQYVGEPEMSDEGYDPYLNCYTDDC